MTWPFLALPLKKTTPLDVVTPFRAYLREVLKTDPELFKADIATLHKLRMDVVGASADVPGRDIVYRYFAQLEGLDGRVRIDEEGLRLLFTWYLK